MLPTKLMQQMAGRVADKERLLSDLKLRYADEVIAEVEDIIDRIARETPYPYSSAEKFRNDLYDFNPELRAAFVAECLDGPIPTHLWGAWAELARAAMAGLKAAELKAKLGIA